MEIEEANRSFLTHLVAYIIVNAFLIIVNLYASRDILWFPWVLVGWGLGLAFHFAFSRKRFVLYEWEEKVAKIELRARKKSQKT